MQSNPKISIIIPVYNVEPYLRQCLDSAAGQTLKEIEIICIDDGSTDNSLEILNEYANKDDRFIVLKRQNRGAGAARNAGIAAASGEYVGFVDSDDYIGLNFFEKLYSKTIGTSADIVKGAVRSVDCNGKESMSGPRFKDIKENRAYFNWTFWSAIYKRKFLKDNKIDFPEDIITGQDNVFLAKAVVLAGEIEFCETVFYVYVRKENSLDSDYLNDKKIAAKIERTNRIFDFINAINTDRKIYIAIFCLNIDFLLHNVFFRNKSIKIRLLIIRSAIEMYKKCKYPQECALSNPLGYKYLAAQDEAMLFLRILHMQEQDEIKKELFYKGLGFIPLLKVSVGKDRKSFLLFNFLPLLVIRYKREKTIYRLFGFLPVFVKQFKEEFINYVF
jgi:glycosyltransferase involved in cell wall biosynthesis